MKHMFQKLTRFPPKFSKKMNRGSILGSLMVVAVVGTLSLSIYSFIGEYIEFASVRKWDPDKTITQNFGEVLGWGGSHPPRCTAINVVPLSDTTRYVREAGVSSQTFTLTTTTINGNSGSGSTLPVNGWQWTIPGATFVSGDRTPYQNASNPTIRFNSQGEHYIDAVVYVNYNSGSWNGWADCPRTWVKTYTKLASNPTVTIPAGQTMYGTLIGEANGVAKTYFSASDTDGTATGNSSNTVTFSGRTWNPGSYGTANDPTAQNPLISYAKSGNKTIRLTRNMNPVTYGPSTVYPTAVWKDVTNISVRCTPQAYFTTSPNSVLTLDDKLSFFRNYWGTCVEGGAVQSTTVKYCNETNDCTNYPTNYSDVPGCNSGGGEDNNPDTVNCAMDVIPGTFEPGERYTFALTVSNGNQTVTDNVSVLFMALPWFQVLDGNVHIDENTNEPVLFSKVPDIDACTGIFNCSPYFYRSPGTGLLTYQYNALTALELNDESGGIGENAWGAVTGSSESVVRNGGTVSLKFNYQYFYDQLRSYLDTTWDGSTLPTGADNYYYKDSSVNLVNAWNIGTGVNRVFLVNGDVTIRNNIDVANNAGLLIVASGTITIADNVDFVEGFYIADKIVVGTNGNNGVGTVDKDLVVEGGLIAANGMIFYRNIGINGVPGENYDTPAESFKYRPDIAYSLRSLREIETFNFIMKEVAPEL